jgi:hypothetical protein
VKVNREPAIARWADITITYKSLKGKEILPWDYFFVRVAASPLGAKSAYALNEG